MKQDAGSNSFRRKKLIEEMAPQRKAERLASDQTSELSNINDRLVDTQYASEMTAEAVEQKGDQIIQSLDNIGNKLDDQLEMTELAAEASEKTTGAVNKLTDVMSEKMSQLSNLLQEKLTSVTPGVSTSSESTTLQAIKDAMPLQVEQPKLEELLTKLVPPQSIPEEDAPFIPSSNPEQPKEEKKDDKGGGGFLSAFTGLNNTMTKGFKGVISVTDRIAGMLFKYTLSAAASAAKLAAALFGLILGLDSIQVYFQYFMDTFESSWKTFDEKFEKWGNIIEPIVTMAKNVSAMFEEGKWKELFQSVMRSISDFTTGLADLLLVGMAKLTAYIIRSLPIPGAEGIALKLEGGALQGAMDRGMTLNDDEHLTLAKYQDKQDQERTEGQRIAQKQFKGLSDEGMEQAIKNGSVSRENAEMIKNNSFDFSFQEKSEEERQKAFIERNKADSRIIKTGQRAERLYSPSDTDKKNMKEATDEIKTALTDGTYQNVPSRLDTGMLLEKLNNNLDKFEQPKLTPAPVDTKEEVQQVKRVDEAQRAKQTPTAGAGFGALPATVNSQVNIQKTNKTQYNIPPQSATNAPGMLRSTNIP